MGQYTRKALQGSIIVLLFQFGAGLLGYIVRIMYARQLSVYEFGMFYALIAFFNLIFGFKSLGLNQSLIKFIPEYLEKREYGKIKGAVLWVSGLQISLALIFSIILWILSEWLCAVFFKDPDILIFFRALVLGQFVLAFVDIFRHINQGYQHHLWFSLYEFSYMGLILGMSSILFFALDMNGLIVPVIVYATYPVLLGVLYYARFFTRTFPGFLKIERTFSRIDFTRLFRFGVPLIFATLGGLILGQTDIIMLTWFHDATVVSLYNASLPASKIITYFAIGVSAVFFPLTAELWIKKDMKNLIHNIRRSFIFSSLFLIPLTIVFISFPKVILTVLFGEAFSPAFFSMQILSVGMLFYSYTIIGFSFIKGIGRTVILTKIVLVGAVLNLILNFIFVPMWGIVGASISTAICYIVMMIMHIYYLKYSMESFIITDE